MKLPKNFMNINLGLNIAIGLALCVFLGRLFDLKRGRGLWGVGIGIAAGLIYASFEIWKFLKTTDYFDKNS